MKPSELLDKPEKWCQGTYARNKDGKLAILGAPSAVSWCILGALKMCHFSLYGPERQLLDKLTGGSVVTFNDTPGRTFEEVRAKLIEAGL